MGGMSDTKRTVMAFALAPLTPPAILWALTPDRSLGSLVLMVTLGAVSATYPLMLGIGLPSYVLITKSTTLRLWHVLAISGSAGCFWGGVRMGGALTMLFCAALGSSAGITFWLIWHRRPCAQR
jgi:hypothetical protein